MTNVIPFAVRPAVPQVRITAGTITASTDPRDIGRSRHFLTFVDIDGAECGVWEGDGHQAALAAAREWERDGAEIIDETQTVH